MSKSREHRYILMVIDELINQMIDIIVDIVIGMNVIARKELLCLHDVHLNGAVGREVIGMKCSNGIRGEQHREEIRILRSRESQQ